MRWRQKDLGGKSVLLVIRTVRACARPMVVASRRAAVERADIWLPGTTQRGSPRGKAGRAPRESRADGVRAVNHEWSRFRDVVHSASSTRGGRQSRREAVPCASSVRINRAYSSTTPDPKRRTGVHARKWSGLRGQQVSVPRHRRRGDHRPVAWPGDDQLVRDNGTLGTTPVRAVTIEPHPS